MGKEPDGERSLTCTECYLTFAKSEITTGEFARCPRCKELVVA